jgi:CRISPR/Cas system CSM-associated protein Csm4 (group 5 of RAMP superfamily)
MKFNVSLDKEQIEEIAGITADKVLYTVQYHRNNEKWYEREIEDLKAKVQKRDSMLVQKDLTIERQREYIRKLKEKANDK